ncbi:hypothetical protein [Roseateles sp. P5_E7]
MRPAALMIAASLMWTACAAVDNRQPLNIEPGKPFTLPVGGTAQLTGLAVQVGFDGVVADSRCAKGEQCIVAGRAVARVWWRRAGGAKEQLELHSAMGGPRAARIGDFELALTAIEPPLISGKPVDKAAYLATFVLDQGAPVAADR